MAAAFGHPCRTEQRFFRDQTGVLGPLPLAKIILSSDTCELKEIQHATRVASIVEAMLISESCLTVH